MHGWLKYYVRPKTPTTTSGFLQHFYFFTILLFKKSIYRKTYILYKRYITFCFFNFNFSVLPEYLRTHSTKNFKTVVTFCMKERCRFHPYIIEQCARMPILNEEQRSFGYQSRQSLERNGIFQEKTNAEHTTNALQINFYIFVGISLFNNFYNFNNFQFIIYVNILNVIFNDIFRILRKNSIDCVCTYSEG